MYIFVCEEKKVSSLVSFFICWILFKAYFLFSAWMTLDFNGIIDAYTATVRRLLNNLEVEELQELLKNPDKLDDLIKNQNQVGLFWVQLLLWVKI